MMKTFYISVISLLLSFANIMAITLPKDSSYVTPYNLLKYGIRNDRESKFACKLNLTQLIFPAISIQAEYAFHKKMSVALGYSRLPKRKLPEGIYNIKENPFASNFSTPVFEGRAITPEFRFYPFGREGHSAPNGFYLGAYVQYAHYVANQTVSYQDFSSAGSPIYTAKARHDYSGTTGGLLIGRQWIIARYVTLDWWIIGGGYGQAKYTYSWTVDGINLTPEQQVFLKQQAEENFSSFSMFGISSEMQTTENSAFIRSLLPMYSLRFMGICLGFAF